MLRTNVDAQYIGGTARFANHSCDPTMEIIMLRPPTSTSTTVSQNQCAPYVYCVYITDIIDMYTFCIIHCTIAYNVLVCLITVVFIEFSFYWSTCIAHCQACFSRRRGMFQTICDLSINPLSFKCNSPLYFTS